jgi:hypothetical protein
VAEVDGEGEEEDQDVIISATARYESDADEGFTDDNKDQWGFVETDPVGVCTLVGCKIWRPVS